MTGTNTPEFVLFGGSFNPVHVGHLEIIRQLAALPWVAQVLAVLAGQSPFKPDAPLLPAELRLRMLSVATATLPRVAVLDWELRRPAPSYTVDTVHGLRQLYPDARLWLAMGADVYNTFAAWHRPAELLAAAGLLVFPRADAAGGGATLDPAALPEPWRAQVKTDAAGNLADATGRVVVRHVPLRVPAVAASTLLRERNASQVPEPARALLAAYWAQTPATHS